MYNISMSEKSLSDLNMPEQGVEFEKESQSLKNVVGQTAKIIGFEFKKLGKYDGVVLTLADPVKDKEGKEWSKIHSSSSRVTASMKAASEQLDKGDILTAKVESGTTANGTWYDLK